MSDIRKIAYARYQMDWMLHNHVSLHDICRIFSEYGYSEYDTALTTDEVEAIFDDVEFDSGRYVCFAEFLGAEYQDASYIRSLLNDEEFIEYLKDTEKNTTVYVYKRYNDEDAYGEEEIKLFSRKKEALDKLAADVESAYGFTIEEMREKSFIFGEDTLNDDYVSILNDGGDTSFFIVEEKELS